MAQCRDCHAELIWAFTSTGRKIPIDPTPTWDGDYVLDPEPWPLGSMPTAHKVAHPSADVQLRTAHLDTCVAREDLAPTRSQLRRTA